MVGLRIVRLSVGKMLGRHRWWAPMLVINLSRILIRLVRPIRKDARQISE